MNEDIRKLLRDAFETGYVQALRAVVSGDLQAAMTPEELDAAVSSAASEWLAELDAARRAA